MTTTRTGLDQAETVALVRAAQAGDREAFGQLYVAFERKVVAIALRYLGDLSDAQEVCQDVFVQAMRKLGQLRTPACFGAWLVAITRRTALNRVTRRREPLGAEPEMLEVNCVEYATPLGVALQAEQDAEVQSGLERLRPMDRETLVAFYVQGRTLVEMSDEFAAPLGTIKRRLHVARKRLAKELEAPVAV